MTTNSTPSFRREEVVRTVGLLLAEGGITELRALDAVLQGDRRSGTASGYFDSPEKLADAVARIVSAKGVYVIPNAVNPDLLSRAANRIRLVGRADPTTSDHDIVRRRWLLIDLDAKRPAGIGSTAGAGWGAGFDMLSRIAQQTNSMVEANIKAVGDATAKMTAPAIPHPKKAA